MQTVDFQCGHCGNWMAVEDQFLGQQMHCPHCQQVVQTSLPTPSVPSPPELSRAEVSPPAAGPSSDVPSFQGGAPAEIPAPGAQGGEFESEVKGDSETALAKETFSSAIPRRGVDRGMRSGLFIALVLIPLISYAVLATVALVILLLRPQPADPLEFLPDREGDWKGAKHQQQGSVLYERVLPESELPNRLKVALGQTMQLGDVEVTPQQVELRRVRFRQPGFAAEPGIDDSLVLHLLFRNISQDVVFSPTDPCFDRRWKGMSQGKKPYTFLEVGKDRLWGGPLPWRPGRPPEERETIEGQHYKMLQPGEQLTTFVCTDPQDHVGRLLAKYHGSLVWRVQVRRGLVQVHDREYPATAVIGVPFRDTDILKPAT